MIARLIARRLLIGVFALWVVTILVFAVIHSLRGDPIAVLLAQNASPEVNENLRAFYGLDQPIPHQYVQWMTSLLQGDLGVSMITGLSVSGMLIERFPRTIYLMIGGLALSLILAVPAGVYAAKSVGRKADTWLTSAALGLQAIPEFWAGTLLVLIFGVTFGILPTSGYVDLFDNPWSFLRHAILPMTAVGAAFAGITARTVRASMIDELQNEYVVVAQSYGIAARRIVWKHTLKNAIAPTVTLLGLQIGILLGGAIITEKVFSYPGMGLLLVNALSQRDYPVIQGGILLFSASFIVVNVLADVTALLLDPRSRRSVGAL